MRLPNYLKYNDEFRAIKSALPFVVIDKFNFPETEPILKELSESLSVSDNKRKRFILYSQMVLANLAYAAYQGKGFGFFRNPHYWSDFNKRNPNLLKNKLSYRTFVAVLKTLEAKGYVISIQGRKDIVNPSNSYATRYFATDALLKVIHEEWGNTIGLNTVPQVKLTKREKGKLIDITPAELPKEIQKEVEENKSLNAFINKHVMTVRQRKLKRVCIKKGKNPEFRMRKVMAQERFAVQLQSIYSQEFTKGGRLYSLNAMGNGNYQGFSSHYNNEETKIDRKSIQIDGNDTVEPDFKCLHINIAYSLCNQQFSGDAYDFIADRKVAKKALLIALNCKSFKQAVKTMRYYLNISTEYAKTIINKMLERHKPLQDLLFKNNDNIGCKLQYLDSRIMRAILLRLQSKNIVALPVHDSVICQRQYALYVKNIMKEEYKRIMGYSIEVEV